VLGTTWKEERIRCSRRARASGITPELRFALLGIRAEAAGYSMQLLGARLADAEELMRSAPRGSIPWTQAHGVYFQGMMMAGRIADLLAAIEVLWEVEPDLKLWSGWRRP